jgi:hypothetical protein
VIDTDAAGLVDGVAARERRPDSAFGVVERQ